MDRSTWVSAAKWTRASADFVTRSMSFRSHTSPWTNVRFRSSLYSLRLFGFPAYVSLSTTTTSSLPAANRRRTKQLPMKPMPPVTTRRAMMSSLHLDVPIVRDVLRIVGDAELIRLLVVVQLGGEVHEVHRFGSDRLEPVDHVRRDLDQHGVPLARKELVHLAFRRGPVAIVVADHFRGPSHHDEMICLLLVIVPALHDSGVPDRDVRLREPLELRPIGAEHFHEVPPFVVDLFERPDDDALNQIHGGSGYWAALHIRSPRKGFGPLIHPDDVARILDVGGTGLLGQYIGQEALRRGHEVIATHRGRQAPDDKRIDWHRLDIRDSSAVSALVRSVEPNLVLNAAAMTDVDRCEADPDEAKYVNETAAGRLASVSNEVGAAFVHISTDYVFDGTGPVTEDTDPHPLNTYGATKLFGERVVRHSHSDSIILRLSSVFGWNRLSSKTNAVTWILQKLEEGQEVPLFQDQKATPSYAKTAAEVAFDLWGRHASGLFHVSCPDCASRVEMGRAVADVFHVSNPKLTSIPLASVALRANRPLAPCLVVRKVEETLKRPMPTFRACLEDMKATR